MHDQIRYFRFVAQFVDAVTTEPLAQSLRNGPRDLDALRRRNTRRMAAAVPPMARAA